MGYRSQIGLKTTTEGYLLAKKFNDSIPVPGDRPLVGLNINKTESGFYKISHDCINWSAIYPNVENFYKMLLYLDKGNIPYKFIAIGEDIDDNEELYCSADYIPDEIISFCIIRDILDPNEGEYVLEED